MKHSNPLVALCIAWLVTWGAVMNLVLATETQKQETPFAVIEYPASVQVNGKVTITIRVKGSAIKENTHLTVDQHIIVNGKRQAGKGSKTFGVPTGQDSVHVATFTVPQVDGIARVHYPVYLSAKGGDWGGRTAQAEVSSAVDGIADPASVAPPAPAKPREPHPATKGKVRPIEQPPVEVLSSTRADIVLNGPWKFRPAGAGRAYEQVADDDWGQMWVPGTWSGPTNVIPGVIYAREGSVWDTLGNDMVSAWYERTVKIPADWDGRAIVLDLPRVSTDALVYADGKECGSVTWPGGQVDVTDAVKAGEDAVLRVRVFAVDQGGTELVAMGTVNADFTRPAKLDTRGIIGDVVLTSRPRGAHVSDVLVIPSVTNRKLTLRTELQNAQAGKVTFTARLLDEKGTVEKTFTREVDVDAAPVQKLDLSWDWPDPRLWDLGQPNLYTLQLRAQGAGVDDEYAARFGFREFGIDGKDFVLNGRKVRLRPWMTGVNSTTGGGMQEIADAQVKTLQNEGINYLYIWPEDPERRGSLTYGIYPTWFDAADRAGMLMSAPSPRFDIRERGKPDVITWDATKREAYKKQVDQFLRPYRNHPSIVLWGGTSNQFPLMKEENPRLLGRKTGLPDTLRDYTGNNLYKDLVTAGHDAIAAFKEVDPTRPFYCHHDSFVGEYTNFNLYLGLHALQEREDWFSEWSEHAEMPFASHEFGTPTDVQLGRDKSGNHGASLGAEPLVTEYAAIYFGADAYRTESNAYAAQIAKDYNPKAPQRTPYGKWAPHWQLWRDADNHQALQSLFIRNTWRSWRTWGITGGLFPWYGANYATATSPGSLFFRRLGDIGNPPVDMPEFQPGRRGPYLATVPIGVLKMDDQKDGNYTIMPAGKALLANNQATLAYIAGFDALEKSYGNGFTDKAHHYWSGETVRKQIAVINDQLPGTPKYQVTWSAEIDGKRVGGGELSGQLASGESVLLPIEFVASASGDRTSGVIRMEARVADMTHVDEFPFRVYARPAPAPAPAPARQLAVIDPEGTTKAWLESLGFTCKEWTGEPVPMLIAGRNALRSGLPKARQASIDDYVRAGGRLLVFNQMFSKEYKRNFPEHIQTRQQWGFRSCPQVTRRAWPVDAGHPLTQGMDGEDFRDWRGAGTAYPAELYTEINDDKSHHYAGWHWGNRGSIASQVLETPHLTGWRPILQCEFDLSFTPLMEATVGRGAMIWCALDLEGRSESDPVADIFTRRLVDYAAQMPVREQRPVGYVGDGAGNEAMKLMRLTTADPVADGKMIIVVGSGATDADLSIYTQAGNPILVLARRAQDGPFGVTLKKVEAFDGSLSVPDWSEARGLSASDLRLRSTAEWCILAGGCDVASDGLLGRKRVGKSTVLYCQLDPDALDPKARPYFHYTTWRQTRAIANLLSNLGAEFGADKELLQAMSGKKFTLGDLYVPGYATGFVDSDDPYRWNTW